MLITPFIAECDAETVCDGRPHPCTDETTEPYSTPFSQQLLLLLLLCLPAPRAFTR